MKRHAALLSFAALLLFQDLFASAKTDSVVAFLGGAHAKVVWTRWAWCNDNYQPMSAATAIDTRDLAIGPYLISAHQQGNCLTRQVMIAR